MLLDDEMIRVEGGKCGNDEKMNSLFYTIIIEGVNSPMIVFKHF